MSVITQNPILTADDEANLTADHPIIGWKTVISSIIASSSNVNYPAINMMNPATHLRWRADEIPLDGEYVYVTIEPGTALPMDYIAIARHNLGSKFIPVSIGILDTLSSPPGWTEIVADHLLGHDGPVLFRFPEQSVATRIDIRLGTGVAVAEIAVVYAGKLLVLPRKIYQGFAPIPYARVAKVTNGRSEAGNFLGRIVLQEFVKNTVPLSLIDPTYFRDHIADFLIDSKENPFFFAWRPETYPDEVGYCHMTNDPLPTNEAPHGLVAMQMEMTGVI